MKKNAALDTLDTGAGESGSHARDTRPCKLDYQSEEPPTVRPLRSSTPVLVPGSNATSLPSHSFRGP